MLSPRQIAPLVLAIAVVAGGPARAQYYSSVQQSPPPLYPYATQPRAAQPYAVEVAPGTYVIHRPGQVQTPLHRAHRPTAAKSAAKLLRTRNDPRLIDELRQRAGAKTQTINTTKIVREKPKVVETTRYVDDPPQVVERYTVVDDTHGEKKVVAEAGAAAVAKRKAVKNEKRVIQADAEITILGPDRMTIQLYRKGERGKPGARLN
jgi:hypothetical protein